MSSLKFEEKPCSKSNMPMNNVNIPGQILHHIGFYRLGYAKKFWNTMAIPNFKSDEPQEIWPTISKMLPKTTPCGS